MMIGNSISEINSDLTRLCPECGQKLTYGSKKSKTVADLKNSRCRSCPIKGLKRSQESKDKVSKANTGQKRTPAAIQKQIETRANSGYVVSRDTRKKMSDALSGGKNPMYGVIMSQDSRDKMAAKKLGTKASIITRQKMSAIRKGKKISEKVLAARSATPPNNSGGRGISGWYKNLHFRSSSELSFIFECEYNGYDIKSAECVELQIPYLNNEGKLRHHYSDFLVKSKCIVEIKPPYMCADSFVVLKRIAAQKFCSDHNLDYIMTYRESIPKRQMFELRRLGVISKFTGRHEKQYLEWNDKKSNLQIID